jgi:hypothetical protein
LPTSSIQGPLTRMLILQNLIDSLQLNAWRNR